MVWNSGAGLIVIAAFLFSIGAMCVKLLGETMPIFQVAFGPSLFCWTATSAIIYSYGMPVLATTCRARSLTVLRGLLGAAALLLYYFSIQQLPLKDAVTLFFCSPVIAAALEWLATGEPIGTYNMLGCLSVVLGVFLVTQPDCLQHQRQSAFGMALAASAACANAGSFVVVRLLKDSISAVALTWWYHLLVAAVTLIPLLLRYPHAPAVLSGHECLLLTLISVCQFAGQILLNRGFQLQSAARGSAINVLQVLFSYAWDMLIIGEVMNWMSTAGSGLVVTGVVTVALASPQDNSQKQQHDYTALPVSDSAVGNDQQTELALVDLSHREHGQTFSSQDHGHTSSSQERAAATKQPHSHSV